MSTKYLLVVLLFHCVLSNGSEECVRYYFEDYDDAFTTEFPYCDGYYTNETTWSHETYDNSTISPINNNSNWYIRTALVNIYGCTSSFTFTVAPGGIVDVNVYFETVVDNDFETILGSDFYLDLIQITEYGAHIIVAWTYASDATPGWRVIRTRNSIYEGNPFQGYIRLLGRSSRNSTLIVDSFRYVPSSMDPEEECILYEDATIPTDAPTTAATTTTTPNTTTITPTTEPATTPDTTPTTTPTTEPATTPDTTPTTIPTTERATTPDTTPTITTTTTPITTTPKNLPNYIVEERFDFRKSIRISKKRITKVVNFDGVNPPALGLE